MDAASYVDTLAKALKMPVEISDSGSAFFEWEGLGLLLQWVEAEQSFVVYAELGSPNGWRDGELFRLLLSANFLLMDTHGGALSWHAGTNMVGINFSLPVYGLTPELFLNKFNAMILLASQWKEELRRMSAVQEKMVTDAQKLVLVREDFDPAESTNAQRHAELHGYTMLRI